jgi:CheY-like chemotaxis protein
MSTTTSTTIMVVEDEPEIRELVAASLAVEGFQVLCADNAAAALDLIAAHPEVELLFTDILMPGDLHGYDLARQARRIRPDLKLLYTSGYALAAAIGRSVPIEAARMVNKPYRLDELIGEIRRALARPAA